MNQEFFQFLEGIKPTKKVSETVTYKGSQIPEDVAKKMGLSRSSMKITIKVTGDEIPSEQEDPNQTTIDEVEKVSPKTQKRRTAKKAA